MLPQLWFYCDVFFSAAQTLVDRVLVSNVQPNSVQQGGMGDWDMFMSGRLGMIPTGIWAFQTFTENCDFAWDIAVEPGSTQKATHFFSNCVVMNPETEHPEEVAEWLAWLTSAKHRSPLANNFLGGRLCARLFRAKPYNSTSAFGGRFCSKPRFEICRNTGCISNVSNRRIGTKDPLKAADAIVRLCQR